jgi:transposase
MTFLEKLKSIAAWNKFKKYRISKKYSFLAIPLILVLIVYLTNFFSLQIKMISVIQEDYRNKGIEVSVHYENYINPNILIYDLKKVSPDKSKADVFRVFLQFADKIQDKQFKNIHIAYKGIVEFTFNGDDFQTIGKEYSWQNPTYTMRTFPEKLYTPDGIKAFSSWEGGILGVLNEQMQDFNDFHDKWYLGKL